MAANCDPRRSSSTGGLCDDGSGGRLYGVMGMAVDPERRLLLAASSAVPEMEGFSEGNRGRALVARYDLDSGRLVQIFRSADGTSDHLFGDLTVHPSGDLYISDSATPAVSLVSRTVCGRIASSASGSTRRGNGLPAVRFSKRPTPGSTIRPSE